MIKTSYKNAKNKKAVRDFLLSFFNESSIIGLAGPDINEYMEWCREKGFSKVEVWEKESSIMMKQLSEISQDSPLVYKFGDIIKAKLDSTSLYDLDFCKTIVSLYEHISKFKNEKFILTMSTRGVGNQETINRFFDSRKEAVSNMIEEYDPIHFYKAETAFGKYVICPYFDTTPMITIAKIS